MLEIQNHPFLPQVFVKVKTKDIMVRVEAKMKTGVRMNSKNITLFGWRWDIPLTTVKLNGVNYGGGDEQVWCGRAHREGSH